MSLSPNNRRSSIIDNLVNRVAAESVQGRQPILGIAFFYCDGNSQYMASDSEIVFSSALRQLVTQCFKARGHQSVIDAVKARFTDRTIFSRDFVHSSLKWIAESFSEVFILIDGIDECPDRENFCMSLGCLSESSNVKVLVAGRPEHDIATTDVFRGTAVLKIDEDVRDDITTHVRWCIERDRKLRRHSAELKVELLTKLTAKCDGM